MRLFEICAGWRASLGENIARHKGVTQAVCDPAGFFQVFGEERNEAERETFSLLLISLLYLWMGSCCLYYLFRLLLLPSGLCLLLLSFSFICERSLQILPIPLCWIRKAC